MEHFHNTRNIDKNVNCDRQFKLLFVYSSIQTNDDFILSNLSKKVCPKYTEIFIAMRNIENSEKGTEVFMREKIMISMIYKTHANNLTIFFRFIIATHKLTKYEGTSV